MKIRINQKWKDRLLIPAVLAAQIGVGYIFRDIYQETKADNSYRNSVAPIIEQTLKVADANRNGYLEPEESLKLLREFGFSETIPCDSMALQITPLGYREKTLELRVVSSAPNYQGYPVYDRKVKINLSDIEEYIQLHRENRK
jgi:hypothetical protein